MIAHTFPGRNASCFCRTLFCFCERLRVLRGAAACFPSGAAGCSGPCGVCPVVSCVFRPRPACGRAVAVFLLRKAPVGAILIRHCLPGTGCLSAQESNHGLPFLLCRHHRGRLRPHLYQEDVSQQASLMRRTQGLPRAVFRQGLRPAVFSDAFSVCGKTRFSPVF